MTEVGVIPEEWDAPFLGELFTFKNGLNKAKEFFGHGTPIVNYLDVYAKRGFFADDLKGHVNVSKEELKNYNVRKGDVFFTRTSETVDEVGLSSVMLNDSVDTVFSGFVLRARPKDNSLDDQFKKFCFSTTVVRKQITSQSTETTRALTNGRNLSAICIARPPKSEQRAIAEALSDVDVLISALDQLIAKKRDLKQAAMQQLLNGQTRLPGFDKEWKEKQLGDILEKLVGGGTPSRTNPAYWGNEIPWGTVKDFTTYHPCQTQESITKEGLKQSASHLIPAGTLIIATRMSLGRAVIYKMDVAINQDLKALYLLPNADVRFIYYWFEFNAKKIDELGSGSTVKGISISDLKRIPFFLLSLAEQRAIADLLSDLDAEIAALQQRRDKTRDLKQAMMQDLLTGRIRLTPGGRDARVPGPRASRPPKNHTKAMI